MQVTNQSLQAAAPVPASAAKQADTARGPFASLLRQSQSARSAPADAALPDTEPAASADASPEPDTPATPNAPFKARLKVPDKAASPRTAEAHPKTGAPGQATSKTAASEEADGPASKRSGAPVADTGLSAWLAALQQQPVDEATAAPGLAEGETASSGAADAASGNQQATLRDKATADAAARPDPPRAGAAQQAQADAAVAALQAGQHSAETPRGSKSTPIDTGPSAAALGAAAFNPLLGSARESAAPTLVHLPTPMASPEFAQALGVQMSVLASGGVQRAELQLNPAEMGPVSVQIVIDGSSAQVDFGADLAATRHAIEAGLPELAGALRDAGFTLTGGGVSQHSRGRGDSPGSGSNDGRGTRDGSAAGTVATSPPALRRTVSAGGVDLYA